ncbi:TerB family tellurite resistance protein [Motiliproteus sediminis]|uniref:tellurite resistance TerB family protein n=1 Tax=Motiliproteus sediminis TaxID=1468178 RepID=UPI001AEF48F1|nr:TerB family tellurite resistance protein [Motiliproteus sediminis]
MIDALKQFFGTQLDTRSGSPVDEQQALKVATAALLIEASRADYRIDDTEQHAVLQGLRSRFGLEDAAIDAVLALARQEVDKSVSLYPFTRLINEHYSSEHKRRLIAMLWEVAFADGELDKYEDHYIRTVADLIHVSHSDFIRTKLQVAERLGVALPTGSRPQ